MQLEIGPLPPRTDSTAGLGLDVTVLEPSRSPSGRGLFCHFDRSFPSKRTSASEGAGAFWLKRLARRDDPRLGTVRIVYVPFAARQQRRVAEALDPFALFGGTLGRQRGGGDSQGQEADRPARDQKRSQHDITLDGRDVLGTGALLTSALGIRHFLAFTQFLETDPLKAR